MARFETPINDPQVAEALHGLDLQSVMMARSFERSSRLHAFFDQYVHPETLEYEAPDGAMHTYAHRRISAIGDEGSLLHIRLHQQVQGQELDPSLKNIAIISHIDDPHPATVYTATSEDIVRFDATRETRFTVGQPDEAQNLQIVEEPMNQLQWNIEKTIARELALASLPIVSMTGNGWEYRRSDRHWEKLHDIHPVCERVSRALSQGLGYAALSESRPAVPAETGQFTQKVLA